MCKNIHESDTRRACEMESVPVCCGARLSTAECVCQPTVMGLWSEMTNTLWSLREHYYRRISTLHWRGSVVWKSMWFLHDEFLSMVSESGQIGEKVSWASNLRHLCTTNFLGFPWVDQSQNCQFALERHKMKWQAVKNPACDEFCTI
jgi:hypothetical protein